MKLSKDQWFALDLLSEGPMNEAWAAVNLGASRKRTLTSLRDRGLARYYGSSELWHMTAEGRAVWKADLRLRGAVLEAELKADLKLRAKENNDHSET